MKSEQCLSRPVCSARPVVFDFCASCVPRSVLRCPRETGAAPSANEPYSTSHSRATVSDVPKVFGSCQWHCTNGCCVHRVLLHYVILYNINSIVFSVSLLTQAFRPTRRNLVGRFKGALGLGCRSRAPHGVPWTEPSAPCYVAAVPELFIELSRTGRSKFSKDQRGSKGFVVVAPGLVNECRGRATPARFPGARAAQPMTSGQVECGKTEPSHTYGTRTPEHEEH